MQNQYDYIITGGGLAGLSLAYHLSLHPVLKHKRVLLIDRERKDQNDRTWCFWEETEGPFEEVVFKKWDHLHFYSDTWGKELDIAPFVYKMIRGIDFYQFVHKRLAAWDQLDILHGSVTGVHGKAGEMEVHLDDGTIHYGAWVFNSIFRKKIDKTAHNYLDQHFKGWVVHTEKPVFSEQSATLMDFRIPQLGQSRFFYVLPTDAHRALVEIAIFSNDILEEAEYDSMIKDYIREYVTDVPYSIEHEEVGVIPMTDFPFPTVEGGMIHIGTAGGHTKASTGYTFWRLQKFLVNWIENWGGRSGPLPLPRVAPARFGLFDSTMLRVLLRNDVPSGELFTDLFQKNPPARVLRFLNEETSIKEDLSIMSSVPLVPFIRAFLAESSKKVGGTVSRKAAF
jgi:lycopene beta-cyclase